MTKKTGRTEPYSRTYKTRISPDYAPIRANPPKTIGDGRAAISPYPRTCALPAEKTRQKPPLFFRSPVRASLAMNTLVHNNKNNVCTLISNSLKSQDKSVAKSIEYLFRDYKYHNTVANNWGKSFYCSSNFPVRQWKECGLELRSSRKQLPDSPNGFLSR